VKKLVCRDKSANHIGRVFPVWVIPLGQH